LPNKGQRFYAHKSIESSALTFTGLLHNVKKHLLRIFHIEGILFFNSMTINIL